MSSDNEITTITLGNGSHVYKSRLNTLRETTPPTIKKTIALFINNKSSIEFRSTETNLLSISLLGFVDKNATSPPVLEPVYFTEFWEGGASQKTATETGINFKPIMWTGIGNLSEKVILTSWPNGDGKLVNTTIYFKKVVDNTPVNVTGVLYFCINQGAWSLI